MHSLLVIIILTIICQSDAFNLNIDYSNTLLERVFKTFELQENTYDLMERRLDILEKNFRECTAASHKDVVDVAVKDVENKIASKLKNDGLLTSKQQQCVDDLKLNVSKYTKTSEQLYNDCMLRGDAVLQKVKKSILNDVLESEKKVQKKLCALMECSDDKCLYGDLNLALTLQIQAQTNLTVLPIKGYKDYVQEYRKQFERCQKQSVGDLELNFHSACDGFQFCLDGVVPRNKLMVKN